MITAQEFSRRDLFARHNGMEVVTVEPGKARVKMLIVSQHHNGLGMTHGGALFTLADLAFAAASNCAGETVISINATMAYMKATSTGILFADAVEISRSKKLVHYDIKVTTEAGELVAVFHGTGYVKGPAKP
jgi:acyl-CoA thioesterase